jgi:hypothetical protein
MPATLPPTAHAPLIATMRRFLTEIGLENEETGLPADTFLPGLLIDGARLLIDPARLLYPGDILHEAGHLAVTPADERAQLSGNIMANKPEQVGIDGEEIAAMLWSYAACQALGLPAEIVFHPQGYRDQSAWLLDTYGQGTYPGLPLLAWMGLTTNEDFPRMTRWLRE